MPPPDLEAVARSICAAAGFTFRRRAGGGTFKETFEVEANGTALALKIYRPGQSLDRPAREIDAMTRCDHANIGKLVRVDRHTVGSIAYDFCVEEFIPGGTLTAKLQSSGLYSPSGLAALALPLIDAVAHIADLNLVHRDIKTDNVLLRSDGVTPVVVDFGLVRDLTAVSIKTTWAMQGPGTPLFAPPEQLLNQKALIDWRADQFSLGVLLSYCLFNFHPYEEPNDSPADIVRRVASRAGPAQQFRDASARAALQPLIKMTAPWPHERYRRPEMLIRAWAAQGRTP